MLPRYPNYKLIYMKSVDFYNNYIKSHINNNLKISNDVKLFNIVNV